MSRHPLWSRALAAVIAPWFALVMAEPAALHTCSVHSGAIPNVTATAPATASHSMAAHNHGGMNASAAEQAPAAPHHGGNQCSCLGGCCAPSPVRLDTPSVLSWLPVEVLQERPRAATDEIRASADEYLLPFANGPPTRV
ncbi:MAG: hypothetical protein ABI877_10615 [Gemmatimonadaceae bacterium]